MAVLQEFKCPCCDGSIEFDTSSQKMKCPYCDTEFEVETLLSYQKELQDTSEDKLVWDHIQQEGWQKDEETGLCSYVCEACSGEILTDETTIATTCPFCDSPVVMKGKMLAHHKPELVIPFKLDKKAAKEALKKHYAGKRLLPKVFKDENHLEEIKGVYVPVFIFHADADADMAYKTTRVRSWSDSRYHYTETQHYHVARAGSLTFRAVPVDGSSKMDDKLMESIEPFHIKDAVPFETPYLAGYLADNYDVDAVKCQPRANERIKASTASAFAATVTGYSTVVPVSSGIQLKNTQVRHVLYPVWLLNTKWKGQKYTFAMNGQTGKMAGDLPVDKGAFKRWLFGITGAVAAAVFALQFLVWLL